MIKDKKSKINKPKNTVNVINLLIRTMQLKNGKLFKYKNKVIVISGAAGFLANKLIVEFLRNGAEVYGIDNDHKQLSSQYKKIKKIYPTNKFHVIKCDITKESEVKKNIKNILKLSKNIDVLINNAATKTKNLKNFFNPFEKYRLKDWNEVMNVNINGAF